MKRGKRAESAGICFFAKKLPEAYIFIFLPGKKRYIIRQEICFLYNVHRKGEMGLCKKRKEFL